MSSFVALFRGKSMKDAEVVHVSSDPATVARVAESMLAQPQQATADPVLNSLQNGRRQALNAIKDGK